MKQTRRNILRKASALTALGIGASGIAAGADCSSVPEWDADTTYTGGDQVTYDGALWTAEWWTQDEPSESANVWTREGACGGSGGDGGDDGGDDSDSANCDGYPQYDSGATYTGGDRVIYDGRLWEAEWWTSGTEPAESQNVWTLVGTCGNFAPTAVASASPSSPEIGETVTFDGSDSADQDGSITSYEWRFDDGTTETGETVTRSYDAKGEYTATLTVTDDAGATASDSVSVAVGDTGGGSEKEDDVFAPYQGTWGSLVDGTLNVDTDRVVVSFVGDATDDGEVNPGWLTSGGQRPLTNYTDEIQTLQDNGIEVWVAIGGWDGRTVARDATDATELKNVYADILDTLGVTHLDIDDENANEAGRDGSVYEIRNEALAMLQDERPEVKISYTVPAGQGGIENRNYSPAKDMVSDAVEKGIDLSYVNIMTMGFSGDYTSIIPSAGQGTVDWLANVYPDKSEQERWEMLGVTPNVGEDNFTTDDANAIVDWAENEDLGLLSFWALYKSSAAEQAEIFATFESDED
ncbi:PKD domain-containing protein [Halomicrobium sp. LC1Hm]|uniref:PKD domain-containing protein n=1 Tax=Halomicrobium sp. LC1Hm TaxID=2610902 RepID=UPI0012982B62|nr:PKD domain-containing protein [Halomicrobium sp. LC1Hm]QGA83308.1 Glycosyl hydrolase family 18, contains cellulose binding domain [Halomicrobium sp. LC1Hm]